MNELTPEQKAILERRRAGFDQYVEERLPVLVDFVGGLELPDPPSVLNNAEVFLPPIDQWIAQQDMTAADQEDYVWVTVRLAYFLGELLVQRFHGCWYVDDNPNGRYFGHYVVGRFPRVPNARVDPTGCIVELLDQPIGRSLATLVDEISADLNGMASEAPE